jgi:hypothetical protein
MLFGSPRLMDHLAILSQTIADHARKLAHEEWKSEHGNFLEEILRNTVLNALLTTESVSLGTSCATLVFKNSSLKAFTIDSIGIGRSSTSRVDPFFNPLIDEEQK